MARENNRKRQTLSEAPPSNTLGAFIRKARQDVGMSLRGVEEATSKEISNGYLSQLESGKIAQPSPRVLYALAQALRIDYEVLMQRAGYVVPTTRHSTSARRGQSATFAIDNLTAEEEGQLLEYLAFLRMKKR